MKLLSYFVPLLPALIAVGCLTAAPKTRGADLDLIEILTKQLASSDSDENVTAQLRTIDASAPSTTLQSSGLRTGTLQPSTGLHSAARGLTPIEEWRRLFPKKAP
jgi:hypothetical protein